MEIFISILLKIVSIVMMLLFIASVALLIFTFRKLKKVSVLSIAITIAISLITLVIFSALINYDPPFWLWLLMAAIGIAVGYYWARTTKVFIQDNRVMSRNSIWYLVVWGAIFAFNQLITIITNRPPDIAMALLIISTATVWGTNASIIRRYFRVSSELQPQAAGQTAATQTQSNPALPATLAKMKIPGATSELSVKSPSPVQKTHGTATGAAFCSKCGAPLEQDSKFCMKCGAKL